jgi:hypothetical protein
VSTLLRPFLGQKERQRCVRLDFFLEKFDHTPIAVIHKQASNTTEQHENHPYPGCATNAAKTPKSAKTIKMVPSMVRSF